MSGLDHGGCHVVEKASYTKYSGRQASEIGGTGSDALQTDSYRMFIHPTSILGEGKQQYTTPAHRRHRFLQLQNDRERIESCLSYQARYISTYSNTLLHPLRLTLEQPRIFPNLSRVCRFFANFYLPGVFEFLYFSCFIFRDDMPTRLCNDAIYKTSREGTLCTQGPCPESLPFQELGVQRYRFIGTPAIP